MAGEAGGRGRGRRVFHWSILDTRLCPLDSIPFAVAMVSIKDINTNHMIGIPPIGFDRAAPRRAIPHRIPLAARSTMILNHPQCINTYTSYIYIYIICDI